jgi:hypothetical protein
MDHVTLFEAWLHNNGYSVGIHSDYVHNKTGKELDYTKVWHKYMTHFNQHG